MKQSINVTMDPDLREEAREYKINLSETLQQAVLQKVKQERARRWREENREAIETYNKHVEEHGVWSDGWRRW